MLNKQVEQLDNDVLMLHFENSAKRIGYVFWHSKNIGQNMVKVGEIKLIARAIAGTPMNKWL